MSKRTTKVKGHFSLKLCSDVLNDDYIQSLSPRIFKSWINCLSLASIHGGRIPVEYVAHSPTESTLAALVELGLFAKSSGPDAAYVSSSRYCVFEAHNAIEEMRARATDGFVGGFLEGAI